jgi:hypothetical protein
MVDTYMLHPQCSLVYGKVAQTAAVLMTTLTAAVVTVIVLTSVVTSGHETTLLQQAVPLALLRLQLLVTPLLMLLLISQCRKLVYVSPFWQTVCSHSKTLQNQYKAPMLFKHCL